LANYAFCLPDVGEGVAEAEIVEWRIKVGDQIDEDQLTVDVMTDKATVEMTSPVAGRVIAINGEIGERLPVGSVLFELETDQSGASESGPSPTPRTFTAPASEHSIAAPTRLAEPAAVAELKPAIDVPRRTSGGAPLAAPATRRRAYELGVDLETVFGTGPAGRITADDLKTHVAHSNPKAFSPLGLAKRDGFTENKIVGLRRMIAENMQESKRRIPHFTYVEEFDLTELEGLRRELNAAASMGRQKLTLLPFFMRGLVTLVAEFPRVNARYDDEAGILRVHDAVHIGIATQTSGGLIVPVVRHAEARDLDDCATELSRVTHAARERKATRDELTGSTITLTSLGALGGVSATPVINRPEVAIIGPNKLVDRTMVLNGQVSVRTMMNVSSSFDHRIIDGHEAARFIQGLKRLIERPALLFVDRQ
jgi:2-oxoisovalerate dehydrogenase E2 component (dihydrolipoyl transacylase)